MDRNLKKPHTQAKTIVFNVMPSFKCFFFQVLKGNKMKQTKKTNPQNTTNKKYST